MKNKRKMGTHIKNKRNNAFITPAIHKHMAGNKPRPITLKEANLMSQAMIDWYEKTNGEKWKPSKFDLENNPHNEMMSELAYCAAFDNVFFSGPNCKPFTMIVGVWYLGYVTKFLLRNGVCWVSHDEMNSDENLMELRDAVKDSLTRDSTEPDMNKELRQVLKQTENY